MEKAEVFSDHFKNIFTNEPALDLTEQIPLVATTGMEVITFSEEDIRSKLSKLKPNKSPGPDSIHFRVSIELQNVISGTLKDIFDHSYEYGVLPED